MVHKTDRTFAGRSMSMETGRLARQAHGSALLRFGDTMVLAAVTVSDNTSSLPFFPMTVEYREKTYAAGKFPGGFIKREGRPSDDEILACRLIDRTLRPLFPDGFKNEVQVFIYVLSADQENDADVIGLTAASLALSISKVPWNGPVAGVRVGRVDGEWIINPTFAELENSDIDLIAAGDKDNLMMVEGGALELPEADISEALLQAHKAVGELAEMQGEIIAKASQPKMEWESQACPADISSRVEEVVGGRLLEAINGKDKEGRAEAVNALREEVKQLFAEEDPDSTKQVSSAFYALEKRAMRTQVIEKGERVDGRALDTVRPIACETGLLPRTHGSALFTRGQTQALVSTTLGSIKDEHVLTALTCQQKPPKVSSSTTTSHPSRRARRVPYVVSLAERLVMGR